MSDFLVASNAAQKIIEDLNRKILGGKSSYQLVVVPPEEGGFLQTIGFLSLMFVGNVTLNPIASNYALGVFEELTQHKPSDYGKDHVRALRDLTTGFFLKEVKVLEKCIPCEINLDRAFKAKSDFYISCRNNKCIKGIDFYNSKKFLIHRDNFEQHISKDRIRFVDSDFYIYEAVLVSPVDVDKDMKWVFQDIVTKTKISAYMRDKSFKTGFLNGQYPAKQFKEDDVLKILVEYKKQEKNGEIEIKETCIETVYSFNYTEITPIPKNLPKGIKFEPKNERSQYELRV